jgi:hypothetical protein
MKALIIFIIIIMIGLYFIKIIKKENFNIILENKIIKNKKNDSYQNLLNEDNKKLKTFTNDQINQINIVESANDIINNIDKIDYGIVKTGYDKCINQCSGLCFKMGYTGNATCYPKY